MYYHGHDLRLKHFLQGHVSHLMEYISLPLHESLILTLYLHISALCRLANFLNELHNLLYQKPCFISLSVSSRCLLTKLANLSQIRLILMSCEIYTPYVGLVGIIITTHIGVINYIKIKIVPYVKPPLIITLLHLHCIYMFLNER